jgi:ketosteroid isomerase-like protein
MIRVIALALSSMLFFGTSDQADVSSLTHNDIIAIRRIDSLYVAASLAHQWDDLVGLLSPDGALMPPNEPIVIGRTANLARFRGLPLTSFNYSHKEVAITGMSTIAYVQGTYSLAVNGSDGKITFVDRGKYLWVVRKQRNGRWLADRIIWNTDLSRLP